MNDGSVTLSPPLNVLLAKLMVCVTVCEALAKFVPASKYPLLEPPIVVLVSNPSRPVRYTPSGSGCATVTSTVSPETDVNDVVVPLSSSA